MGNFSANTLLILDFSFGIAALIAYFSWQSTVKRKIKHIGTSNKPRADLMSEANLQQAIAKLSQDEIVVSCTQMFRNTWELALLTNRNFRSFTFSERSLLRRNKPLVITGMHSIPIHEIQIIEYVKYKNKYVSMDVNWTNGTEEYGGYSTPDVTEFIEKFEKLHQEKVHLEQTKMVADAITHFAELANEGLLTEEELVRAKSNFVGKPTSKSDEIVSLIRQLHSLHSAGALTDSEYRMKKWDLLSKN